MSNKIYAKSLIFLQNSSVMKYENWRILLETSLTFCKRRLLIK